MKELIGIKVVTDIHLHTLTSHLVLQRSHRVASFRVVKQELKSRRLVRSEGINIELIERIRYFRISRSKVLKNLLF